MIVVFGSITLDLIVSPKRLPKVGETALVDAYVLFPGGKGANQAYAAARSGADVRFIGSVGNDDFADLAIANLRDIGIDLNGLARADLPTACASVWVDGAGDNQIVVASGANLGTRARQLSQAPPNEGDVCLLQLELNLGETWQAIQIAKDNGARVVLNAAPFQTIPETALDILDVLILNEIEAEMIAEDGGLSTVVPHEIAISLGRKHNLAVVVTLGGDGAVGYDPVKEWCLRVPALDITPLDTVGAGDAFVGAFAGGFHDGQDLGECMRRGAIAGALTCLGPGAQESVPDQAMIEARVSEIAVEEI